jgi:glycosyltransferase involved in cell wall biosynthesis
MKKIIFVTRNMRSGGAERVISLLANQFTKKDIECVVVTLDDEEVFYQLSSKVKLYAIGLKSTISYFDKFLKYKDLRKYIQKCKPNIVLAMPEEIGIFVITALIGTKTLIVVSERNNPWVMPYKKITRVIRKLVYPFANGIIFQTEMAKSFFPKYIQNKGVVLDNPLDLSKIPEQYSGERKKIIVGAGRLVKQKNFSLLIDAFSIFYSVNKDYKLVIYGEGNDRKELENYALEKLPLDVVSFPGTSNDLLNKIFDAAIFVLSSDYEGVPNILIEAMAIGMPVISTDCEPGGARMLIQDRINGLLVPIKNQDLLANAISIIANDSSFALSISEAAISIRQRFDAEKVASDWLNYLEDIVQKKGILRDEHIKNV